MELIDEEERLWLVDDNDTPIGEGWQLRTETLQRGSFRVINAFLRNKEGKIWVPRRSMNKRMFPGALDMSVGGHVTFGETYTDCFRRETFEELGLEVDSLSWRFIGKLSPYEHPLSAWMEVYEISYDEAPPYNTNDFTEYYWLSEAEFKKQLEEGDTAKGDLGYLISWYGMLAKRDF